ncbi:MAG: hypothetical protein LIR50_14725 [Bacillota bacterium]|nr:hypothetical protein [Bacillota bacterium]
MWAIVDLDKEEEENIVIYCVPTGTEIPEDMHYLGSYIDNENNEWHYFADEELFQ